MNIYTKELKELAIARKRDIITSEQQKAAVAHLNAQMKAGTGVFANAATGMQIVGKGQTDQASLCSKLAISLVTLLFKFSWY